MGIRNDIRKIVAGTTDGARELVRGAAAGVEAWQAERRLERMEREVDARIAKAASEAIKNGRDGTHRFDDEDADEDDNPQGFRPGQQDDDGGKPGGPRPPRPPRDVDPGDGDDEDSPWSGPGLSGPFNPVRGPKAISFDPFDLVSLMGWRERPHALTFKSLERVASGVPVITDIIRTRIRQVEAFCQVPEDRHGSGFEVRLRDKTKTPTPESREIAHQLEQAILTCGFTDPTQPSMGVPLKQFAAMFIRDSLSYDQATFEVIPDRKGRPSHWRIVDGTTIRLLDPIAADEQGISAVQVIDDVIVADFTPEELAFCIRNPRSGIRTYGYGESEIESMIREVTGFLWGIEYNRKFFSQGSSTKGILNFKGTMPEKHLQAFRRQWYAMVSGVANAWRTPITNAEDLQWISLQMSNRDMEYSAWMDFLIKIACARFQIAPEEVNFSYGNTGQSQAMGTAPVEEKLKASKDLGLKPLVQWFFSQLDRHFIQKLHPDFEVVPVGFESESESGETQLLKDQTQVWMTVDEARQIVGKSPLPDGKGEVILNPTWLQFSQGKEAAAMGMPPGGAPPGEDGPPGAEDEDGPPGDNGDDEDDGGPTGGLGVANKDGSPFQFDDEDDGDADPGVAKSQTGAVGSARSGIVRYRVPLNPSGGLE